MDPAKIFGPSVNLPGFTFPTDMPPVPVPTQAQVGPDGLQARNSTGTDLPPRNSILANGGKESTTQAKEDAKTSMDNLKEINEINMKFQMDMSQLQMIKGFVEAQAKAVKDIGTKIAQAAG